MLIGRASSLVSLGLDHIWMLCHCPHRFLLRPTDVHVVTWKRGQDPPQPGTAQATVCWPGFEGSGLVMEWLKTAKKLINGLKLSAEAKVLVLASSIFSSGGRGICLCLLWVLFSSLKARENSDTKQFKKKNKRGKKEFWLKLTTGVSHQWRP